MTPTDTDLLQAQAVIVAMLRECGLSSVKICVQPVYNRYAREASNGGGGVFYGFTSLAELRNATKPPPQIVQASIFDAD